ncbi:hypothetical protein C8Q74DRAFT_327178 [Fomes fomentarius]|nr:hypothetical protein C8Q74DRAFT_327178 [Fomes fomentarius]
MWSRCSLPPCGAASRASTAPCRILYVLPGCAFLYTPASCSCSCLEFLVLPLTIHLEEVSRCHRTLIVMRLLDLEQYCTIIPLQCHVPVLVVMTGTMRLYDDRYAVEVCVCLIYAYDKAGLDMFRPSGSCILSSISTAPFLRKETRGLCDSQSLWILFVFLCKHELRDGIPIICPSVSSIGWNFCPDPGAQTSPLEWVAYGSSLSESVRMLTTLAAQNDEEVCYSPRSAVLWRNMGWRLSSTANGQG